MTTFACQVGRRNDSIISGQLQAEAERTLAFLHAVESTVSAVVENTAVLNMLAEQVTVLTNKLVQLPRTATVLDPHGRAKEKMRLAADGATRLREVAFACSASCKHSLVISDDDGLVDCVAAWIDALTTFHDATTRLRETVESLDAWAHVPAEALFDDMDAMATTSLYSEGRAAESAAYLLHLIGKPTSPASLLSLMYLAERKSLELYGVPLIGDNLLATVEGPVLATVRHLAAGDRSGGAGAIWRSWIMLRPDKRLELRKPLDESKLNSQLLALSKMNLQILRETWGSNSHLDELALKAVIQRSCPEWERPAEGDVQIEYRRLFEKLDLSPDTVAAMVEHLEEQEELQRLVLK